MCPKHKTEKLESYSFLRSVCRNMRDFLPEHLSFPSLLPLTQSPSLGKTKVSSGRLWNDRLVSVQNWKRLPGVVSSEVFQMYLKERKKNPLSAWVLFYQIQVDTTHFNSPAIPPLNAKWSSLPVHCARCAHV